MKLNHQQMKEKFGTCLVRNVLLNNTIEERYKGLNDYNKQYFDLQSIKDEFEKNLYESFNSKKANVERVLKNYRELPFFKKIKVFFFNGGYKVESTARDFLEKESMKLLENIFKLKERNEIQHLPEDKVYEVDAPDLKVGDTLFVFSSVKEKLVKCKISNLTYSLINDNEVKLKGELEALDCEDEFAKLGFDFKVENDKLVSYKLSESIFRNESEANKYYHKYLNKMLSKYQNKLDVLMLKN